MQIALAVFGVYHHFELAPQLHRRGHLQKIYSSWPWARLKREGLPHSLVSTFPLIHTADYLLNHSRFYPPAISSKMNSWNTLAFDRWTSSRIGSCDAFIAISGAGLLTGHKVQTNGGDSSSIAAPPTRPIKKTTSQTKNPPGNVPHPT